MWESTKKVSVKKAELSLNWQLRIGHLEIRKYIQRRMSSKGVEWAKAEIQENHSR